MSWTNSDITHLFEPSAIAIIGASHDEKKIGYKILSNVVSGGYKGAIYPINPKGGKILGLDVYQSLNEVPNDIDLVVIAIPSSLVFDAIKKCADKNVKFAAIITSGFSEIGNIDVEKHIVEYARSKNMRILGPNIFGVYSAYSSLNATFGPSVQPGSVAIITQSGALGLSMIGKTAVENMGLSTIVSVGNKSDINEADLLSYLGKQASTKVILMYIEGIHEGERLIKVLKTTAREKPIIVIKSGRSQRGAIAVASHTGSLAGADNVFDDIMKQCGVLRAENIQEAFHWCRFFANVSSTSQGPAVIITNGGGLGVMAADACEKFGVDLCDNVHMMSQIFGKVTPDFGSTKNPIDITGQATSRHYDAALTAALNNDNISAVIGLYCETAVFDSENLVSLIEKNAKKYAERCKPLVFSIFGGVNVEQSIISLRKKRIPIFDNVYDAISSLGAMYWHKQYIKNYSHQLVDADIDINAIEAIAKNAIADNRFFLLAQEAKEIMNIAGIPTPQSYVAHNLDEVLKYVKRIQYPVVMKVVSRDIIHKSEAGGVILNLENEQEIINAYEAIRHSCKQYAPNAYIEGFEIAEMIHSGTEIIVGARKDSNFGPIIMCGLGGIYVEIMKDIAFRSANLSYQEIMNMIKEIKSYSILLGVRGESKKDIDSLINTIIMVETIIKKCKFIMDIEINPVAVYDQGSGVKAVDVRILVSNEGACYK